MLPIGSTARTRAAVWMPLAYLQLLDLLSTLAAFRAGAVEANPLIAFLSGLHPVYGLVVPKLLVITLALCAAAAGRVWAIRWATGVYAAVVAWNLSLPALSR